MFENKWSVLKELFGVCRDGAPSLVDSRKGFAFLIKQKIWMLSKHTACFLDT